MNTDDVLALLRQRRSFGLKDVLPDPIERGAIELILEAANWAPSHGATESLRLQLGRPDIEGWLIESTAERTLSGEELIEIAEPLLLPILDDALNGRPIELELPRLSAGQLTEIAPDLAGFELSLSPGDDVSVRGDALIIDLSLIGSLP